MPAGNTYSTIATTTLGSAVASYTFSSISGSYTDLVLIIAGSTSATTNGFIQFNGDTGTNYSYTRLFGDGSTASSTRVSGTANALLNSMTTSQPSTTILNINNYSNATTFKTVLSRGSDSVSELGASVVLWRNTAAITSITLRAGTIRNFNIGTTFTLYGIAAA
jgi:hypothetical protein